MADDAKKAAVNIFAEMYVRRQKTATDAVSTPTSLADVIRGQMVGAYPPKPPPRKYALFISHAWQHTKEYDDLVSLLKPDLQFSWENLSVPKSNPVEVQQILSKSNRYVVTQLDREIKKAECFLALAGMYVRRY